MSENTTVCSLDEATEENIAVTCTYNILFTNDMACSRIADLMCLLRKTDGVSFQAEQAAKRLEKQMQEYEKHMDKVYSSRASFMADVNQVIEDAISKELEILKDSIKGKFIESGCSHPVLMTAAEMAYLFIDFAIKGFDKRIKEMDERNIPESGNLLYLRLTKFLKPAEELAQRLFDGRPVDLSNKKSRKAIKAIIKKLTDAHLIAKAINEADALTPVEEEKNK